MRQFIPNNIKTSCKVSASEAFNYYKNPATGRVVTAAELFATLIPTVAHIVSQKDMTKAISILDEYKTLLGTLQNNPLNSTDSTCANGNWIGTSSVARSLFQYNNLVFGEFQFRKTPIPALPASHTEPTAYVKILQMNIAVLPDQIKWGSFTKVDLSTNPLFSGLVPEDTRVVFQAPDGTWFDGITKGSRGWNRITKNYADYASPGLTYSPAGGLDLTSAFPAGSVPYDTRVLYKDFDGSMKEGITKGNQTWTRSIPTWFNPGPWTYTPDISVAVPSDVLPPDSRTTYVSDNNLLTDIWIKGETLMYRTFTSTGRRSNWIKLNVRSFGLPPELWNGIDTIATWKEPSGRWVQSITKGNFAWTRYSGTANTPQYLPQPNTTSPQPTPIPTTTVTPIATATPIPTISQSPSPTNTPTPTITPTKVPTPTITISPINTVTPSKTPTPSTTIVPTKTPVSTITQTPAQTVAPTTNCQLHPEGDANCDASIDLLDFEEFRQDKLDITTAKADFNNDKSVDIADFAIFRNGYLKYRAK